MPYRFPKSLKLLEYYLLQKGYDTSRLRSDRHALDMLRRATNWRVKFPSKGKACYKHLRQMHIDLFPSVPLPKAPSKARRVRGIGTTGPASRSRTVSKNVWNEISARTAEENANPNRERFNDA